MGLPTFDGYSLQDGQIITSKINSYNTPARKIANGNIANSYGSVVLGAKDDPKTIDISGFIKSPTTSGLIGILDEFQSKITGENKLLEIISGRSYRGYAIGEVKMPKLNWSQDAIPFNVRFFCSVPYSSGANIITTGSTVSGTNTWTLSPTISGSVFPEPVFTITPTGGHGESDIDTISIDFIGVTTLTLSGNFPYGNPIGIDFRNYKTTVSSLSRNYQGSFANFGLGSHSIKVTISGGGKPAFNWQFEYEPRYY